MIKVEGNAKINLTLDILGKRPDGYHEVAMVMQSIGLSDTVEMDKTEGPIELAINVPWLKADAAYDFLQEPAFHTHKLNLDLTGSLKQGNLKVSIRERYVHSWTPATGEQGNVLRSRLKLQYAFPESRWSPYLAVEVFTWGDSWKKTRHYVACNYDFSDKVQLEAYYLYYAFNGIPGFETLCTW